VVNRSVNPSDRSVFQEPELELAEHVEGPVLDKEAHVIEEFHITKDVEEKEELSEKRFEIQQLRLSVSILPMRSALKTKFLKPADSAG
jgi:hypothetical protein